MTSFVLTYFAPAPTQVLGLLAVLAVALACVTLGALVGGRRRLAAADLVCGWAVAGSVLTLAGTAAAVPFTPVAIALGLAAMAGLFVAWRRDGRILAAGTVRMLVLGLPLIWLVAGMAPSQWDEFSHWLLASRYLVEVDLFPGLGRPPSIADYPAYPYGVSLITYLVSRAAGFFVENAGPLFNVLLLFSFGLVAMRLVRKGLSLPEHAAPGWGMAALGILAVAGVNPTFVQKVILTAYADLPTAVALGMAGVLGWFMLEALADDDRAAARTFAWQMGLALAALVNAKSANLVLAVFVVAGVVLAGLRDPKVSPGRLAQVLPAVVLPAVVVYGAWAVYTQAQIPHGSQTVKPFAQWDLSLIPAMLGTVVTIMLKKIGYFGLMIVVAGFAVRALFRFGGAFDRLAIITATTFVGYNLFLWFAYVAIFGGYTGVRALSYWRYNLHLGMLAVACVVFGGALLWRRYMRERRPRAGSRVAVALVLILPFVFAPKLRFDLVLPKQFVKRVGTEMAEILPAGSRVYVMDPLETGFYAKLMRYQLYGVAALAGDTNLFHGLNPREVMQRIDDADTTHLWVHTQADWVAPALGVPLAPRTAHLLARAGGGWTVIRSWPYPGYNLPQDIPD